MKKNKITGIICTLALHLLVLFLLFWIKFTIPEKQEEGGVPVMLGNTESSQGDSDPYMMTEVDVLPQTENSSAESSVTQPETEQPIITQTDEPSLQIEEKEQPEKQKEIKETSDKPKKQTPAEKPKEKTEAEKRAEEERMAAQAAANKIAGAFGKGSKMGNKGNSVTGTGAQGSASGNSNAGKTHGAGGMGTWDLNGRSLGPEGLPVPAYDVQDEGRVVVTIVVNPAGQVISTSINKRTNTVNPVLRKAAEEAARRARFNVVDEVNNQSGTITYYFKLK